jgi:hypothetical protein
MALVFSLVVRKKDEGGTIGDGDISEDGAGGSFARCRAAGVSAEVETGGAMPTFEMGTVLTPSEGLRFAGGPLSFETTTGFEEDGRRGSLVPESFIGALLEATGVWLRDGEGEYGSKSAWRDHEQA